MGSYVIVEFYVSKLFCNHLLLSTSLWWTSLLPPWTGEGHREVEVTQIVASPVIYS